jgi:biopolymer transport protein ExbD
MRLLRPTVALLLVFVLATPGCQKARGVLVDETVQLPSQENKAKIIDGPKKDQKISVTASAEGNFSVYITLEKDREAVMDRLANLEALGQQILAKSEKTKEAALEATISAGQDFAVILSNSGPKEVSIKLRVANVP